MIIYVCKKYANKTENHSKVLVIKFTSSMLDLIELLPVDSLKSGHACKNISNMSICLICLGKNDDFLWLFRHFLVPGAQGKLLELLSEVRFGDSRVDNWVTWCINMYKLTKKYMVYKFVVVLWLHYFTMRMIKSDGYFLFAISTGYREVGKHSKCSLMKWYGYNIYTVYIYI